MLDIGRCAHTSFFYILCVCVFLLKLICFATVILVFVICSRGMTASSLTYHSNQMDSVYELKSWDCGGSFCNLSEVTWITCKGVWTKLSFEVSLSLKVGRIDLHLIYVPEVENFNFVWELEVVVVPLVRGVTWEHPVFTWQFLKKGNRIDEIPRR